MILCVECNEAVVPLKGCCPICATSLDRGDALALLLADYDRGLKGRTRTVTVEDDFGGYFKVVDQNADDALMCGFDTAEHANHWAIARGLMPVRSDADTLKILNLFQISEK